MTAMGIGGKPSKVKRVAFGTGRVLAALFRLLTKTSLVLIFIGAGLLIGGFFQFANTVTGYVNEPDAPRAEAIVALTGGSTRIAQALNLLADEKADRLLISGVNPDTKKSDIEERNPSRASLFACCVDLETAAENTIGNAVETKKWMAENGYSSLILVTSGYHMPRSLIEFRRAMPDVKLHPYPVPLDKLSKDGWWKNSGTLRFMLSEYLKFVGAWSRNFLRIEKLIALPASLFGG